MTIEILSTGDELLTGQVTDTNSVWLMDRLWEMGVQVRRKTLVGDDRADLDAAIRETTSRSDIVVMSGGMGPTEDDLTSERVAAVLGVPLVLDENSLRAIEERFRSLGRTMTPNNRKQAVFPSGAEVIPNRYGSAPGFAVDIGKCKLVCLPGVPVEFRGLSEDWVLPHIKGRISNVPSAGLLKLFGVPESHADQAMQPLMKDPANSDVRWGFRAHWPEIHVKWMIEGQDAEKRSESIERQLRNIFGDTIFGGARDELSNLVVSQLAERGEKVAVAESCTGGLLAELITRVPGASSVFDLGIVAYSNSVKERQLAVPSQTITAFGAVSEQVAIAMAEGAREAGASSWGLGITGIAGPSGATEKKPVGLVYIALSGPNSTKVLERKYPGDRARVRLFAAFEALNLLRLALQSGN